MLISEGIRIMNSIDDSISGKLFNTGFCDYNFLIILCSLILIIYYSWSNGLFSEISKKQTNSVNYVAKPRFRKRDKVVYYSKKFFRKVRTFTKDTIHDVGGANVRGRTSRKNALVVKIAKKLLRFQKDQRPRRELREPGPSILEADWAGLDDGEQRLPVEVLYMLQSVRVLGHLEKPIVFELCKQIDTLDLKAGQYVFNVGDPDDSIYVVQTGMVTVFVTEPDGTQLKMKEVSRGESIHSLLSICDVITGNPAPYKTVSACAAIDSTLLRLPASAFQSVLERFPDSMVRIIQVIMLRLQRVTFAALHNYLGLSSELINPKSTVSDRTSLNVLKLVSPKHSPARKGGLGGKERRRSLSGRQGDPKIEEICVVAASQHQRHTSSPILIGTHQDPTFRKLSGGDCTASFSPPMYDIFLTASQQPQKVGQSEYSLEDMLDVALKDIVKILGIDDESILHQKIFLRHIRAGSELIREGENDCPLVFVMTGSLRVSQHHIGHEPGEERSLFRVNPGEIIGSFAVLTGEPSLFTVRARCDTRIAVISREDCCLLLQKQPMVAIVLASLVVRRMSSFVRQIDFALDWLHIEAGRALFRQGDPSDCIYIVLSGRLRSVLTHEDLSKELVGEFGRGELVGIVEVLTQHQRATTILAVRDTELAQIPDELLNMIKRKYPQTVTRLIHLLGERILGSIGSTRQLTNTSPSTTVNTNLSTVAILPVSESVPLDCFTMELQHALTGIGPCTRLTSSVIRDKLGAAALDSIHEYKLAGWLGHQEDSNRIVLYQCDVRMSPWTKRCIRQADCIVIVACGDSEPSVGRIEKQLETIAVRAQKELVLLHQMSDPCPTNTVEWLNARDWCSHHHHLRCPERIFSQRSSAHLKKMYERLMATPPNRMSDFSRLARFLTSTGVGLVLGGGGARGIAHAGMIKALQEAGVPIDAVGGTSIGSLMGALWAEERDITPFIQRARGWAFGMKSLWKSILDLTYPVTAMLKGGAFNSGIRNLFQDRQIEDLWIPYYCISTDISASQMRVHTNGSLWRYVRASMSLSGYLPPLCDPNDGHLLLDGGYVNNLPADVMKSMGLQTIFAIDVGSLDENNMTNYGDELSGWWLLWKKWNPWSSSVRVPNMAEIQSRLTYVSCVRQLEQVKSSGYCEYLRPPIDQFGTLQFGSFDQILDVGYKYGKLLTTEWLRTNRLHNLLKPLDSFQQSPSASFDARSQKNAFNELAELVSRIEPQTKEESSNIIEPEQSDAANSSSSDDDISTSSEPLTNFRKPSFIFRERAQSEGASPCSTPPDQQQDQLLHENEELLQHLED